MEAEIRQQPELLLQNRAPYHDELKSSVGSLRPEMIVLVARGSSDNAALFARYLIEVFLKIPAALAAPSVLTKFGSVVKYPPCLAIGISQSGAAPDVSEVLASMRANGHATLGITNTPGSRVAETAEFSLDLRAGEERSIAATKTYTSSLLALYQMVRALGADLPEPQLPDQSWLERCKAAAEASLGAVLRSNRWFALGRGYSFSTANETALKLMECALLPCKSYSTADFQHGPRALASHGAVALTFGDEPSGLGDTGCLVEKAPLLTTGPDSPISEVLFGQWIALLAARARGLDPDHALNLQKVTKTL